MPEGKHRKNALVRTEPRVQPAGRHVGPIQVTTMFSVAELMLATFVDNPFTGRSS